MKKGESFTKLLQQQLTNNSLLSRELKFLEKSMSLTHRLTSQIMDSVISKLNR
jgi:hypothetical protein